MFCQQKVTGTYLKPKLSNRVLNNCIFNSIKILTLLCLLSLHQTLENHSSLQWSISDIFQQCSGVFKLDKKCCFDLNWSRDRKVSLTNKFWPFFLRCPKIHFLLFFCRSIKLEVSTQFSTKAWLDQIWYFFHLLRNAENPFKSKISPK